MEEFVKPECELIGQNGNIFNLIGIASRILKRAGYPEKTEKLKKKVKSEAKSYGEALNIIGEFVEIC